MQTTNTKSQFFPKRRVPQGRRAALSAANAFAVQLGHSEIAALLQDADQLGTEFFGGNHTYEADGSFVANPDGSISAVIGNHNGGANVIWNKLMGEPLKQTQDQAQTLSSALGIPMSIIAERLPTVRFKPNALYLDWHDPATGMNRINVGKRSEPQSVEYVRIDENCFTLCGRSSLFPQANA